MRYKITTPVPGHTEVIGGCAFANGVYEGAVDPGPLGYFRTQGYVVEKLDTEPAAPVEAPVDEAAVLPARSASKADWVDAATARAVAAGEDPDKARAAAEALTKEQLVELLTPKGAQE